MSRLALAAVALLLSGAPAGAQGFRTKAPLSHVDLFLTQCRAFPAPAASCECAARTLATTRDGDFLLDVYGIRQLQRSEAEKRKVIVAALDRHGLSASQGQAIIDRRDAIIDPLIKRCA